MANIIMMNVCRFLREADTIIYMEGGRVHSCGSPAEVLPLVEEIRDDKEDTTLHSDGTKSLSNSQEASTTVSSLHSEDCVLVLISGSDVLGSN